MTFKAFSLLGLSAMAALAAHNATAQTQSHAHPNHYSGEHQRPIKALSAQEQQDWLDGKGMGLAKAAELNGYPGPMHTLEHADALQLDTTQRAKTQALLLRHKATVRELGQQLVAEEKHLDGQFASARINPEQLSTLTAKIAALQGRIRAEHLQTHLEQTALLSAEQIARYQVLRGYIRPAN